MIFDQSESKMNEKWVLMIAKTFSDWAGLTKIPQHVFFEKTFKKWTETVSDAIEH